MKSGASPPFGTYSEQPDTARFTHYLLSATNQRFISNPQQPVILVMLQTGRSSRKELRPSDRAVQRWERTLRMENLQNHLEGKKIII